MRKKEVKMSELISTIHRESIFEIVLNRPDKRNAINLEMFRQLDRAVEEAGRTKGVRVVFVRGEGKAFSAGIDVTTFLELPQQ
jgi:enoyl-CoA hydratase/carnithine racemase